MSIHHVECAALMRLPPSTKLVLMAFADSADKDTSVAFPGLDNVMAWSGLRKSRALEVTRWLVTQGYLARVAASKPGQRAEYLVLPAGCCPQHGPIAGYAGPDPRGGSAVADPNKPNRSATADVNNPDGSGTADVNNYHGSATPDVFESGTPDPFPQNGSDLEVNGSDFDPEWVRSRPDPSPPPPSVPPPPPARDNAEPPRSNTSDGGGGADHSGHARWVFDHLGPEWALSASQRERLTPQVTAALQAGWTPDTLAAQLGSNVAGVRNPYAVLRARLVDLPSPPRDGKEPARSPEWCQRCDSTTHRMIERPDGRWERCPNCHPLTVAKIAKVAS